MSVATSIDVTSDGTELIVEYYVGGEFICDHGPWKEFVSYHDNETRFWIHENTRELAWEKPADATAASSPDGMEIGDEDGEEVDEEEAWKRELIRRRESVKKIIEEEKLRKRERLSQRVSQESEESTNGNGEQRNHARSLYQQAAEKSIRFVLEVERRDSERGSFSSLKADEETDGGEMTADSETDSLEQPPSVGQLSKETQMEAMAEVEKIGMESFYIRSYGDWDEYVHRLNGDEVWVNRKTFEISRACPVEDLDRKKLYENRRKTGPTLLKFQISTTADAGNTASRPSRKSPFVTDRRKTRSAKAGSTQQHGSSSSSSSSSSPPSSPSDAKSKSMNAGSRKSSSGFLKHISSFKKGLFGGGGGANSKDDGDSDGGQLKFTISEQVIKQAGKNRVLGKKQETNKEGKSLKYVEVISEIVMTEESYNSDLARVIDIFVSTVREIANGERGQTAQQKLGLSLYEIEFVYGRHLEEIRWLSNKLLSQLKAAQSTDLNSPSRIANVFQEMSEFMHKYAPFNTGYYSYYSTMKRAMESCESDTRRANSKNETFVQIWERFSMEHLNGESLFSFLIKPVQRIPRYALLLRELAKACKGVHDEAIPKVETACQTYEEVTSEINKTVKRHEKLKSLLGDELEVPVASANAATNNAGVSRKNMASIRIRNIYGRDADSSLRKMELDEAIDKQNPASREKLKNLL